MQTPHHPPPQGLYLDGQIVLEPMDKIIFNVSDGTVEFHRGPTAMTFISRDGLSTQRLNVGVGEFNHTEDFIAMIEILTGAEIIHLKARPPLITYQVTRVPR